MMTEQQTEQSAEQQTEQSAEQPAEQPSRVAASAVTAAAALLVLAVLLAPDRPDQVTPWAFARLPFEALAGALLALLLPWRAVRTVAVLGGPILGLLTVGALLDLGFGTVLSRPFDPVFDAGLIGDAVEFLTSSVGRTGATAAAVAAAAAALGLILLVSASVLRLTRVVAERRGWATPLVAGLSVVWMTCATLGVHLDPAVPVAADDVVGRAHDRTLQLRAGLRDRQVFAAQAGVDAFRDTPADDLLATLRGKDVMVAFVESYGRSAIENPELSPGINAVLDAGTRRLQAAGFTSRSAFLTSPASGGGSVLAHATLLSGLWIDNQQRHRTLLATDRLTLGGAFRRAGWRTVGMMPGVTRAWPEGRFFQYDQVYDSRDMGYRGPHFSWAPMPDQYALAAFRRAEMDKRDRQPLMTEIPLVSSHGPWAPLPRLIDWNDLGDGSVFTPMAAEDDHPDSVWRDPRRVRAAYAQSIEYSLATLISYLETYRDDQLVLVFLGDHEPIPVVTGPEAGRDVPITIVTRDRALLDRISSWGWQDGLRPGPQAPVWRMDAFRDRFLTAFS